MREQQWQPMLLLVRRILGVIPFQIVGFAHGRL